MNLRDMDYLVAVAHHKSFSKAANACHVSQPTLSSQVKKIEQRLGAQIFERSNKSVMVTSVGHAIIECAQAVLEQVERMEQLAKLQQDPLSGPCHIGAFPTLAPYVFPRILGALKTQLPNIEWFFVEEKTQVLIERFEQGQIDLALLAKPVESDKLEFISLFDDPFVIGVPDDHPLAERNELDIEHLRAHEILLLEDGHCLRDQAMEVCHRLGTQYNKGFQATSLETLRQMVKAGTAVTLFPTISLAGHTQIKTIPFKPPAPTRTIGLCYRKTYANLELVNRIKDLLTDHFQTKPKQACQKELVC